MTFVLYEGDYIITDGEYRKLTYVSDDTTFDVYGLRTGGYEFEEASFLDAVNDHDERGATVLDADDDFAPGVWGER